MHDLLDLDVDVNAFLPPDTISAGFDNIADVQSVLADADGRLPARGEPRSATLARRRSATRAPSRPPTRCRAPQSQMQHVEGAPFGTRGGISVDAHVPGRRRIHLPHACCTGCRPASCSAASRAAASRSRCRSTASASRCSTSTPRMSETDPNGMNIVTPRIHVKAGPQRVAAAFVQRFDGAGRRPDARRSTTRWPTRRSATASASRRCRTCASSRSAGRSRSPASPTRRAAAGSSSAGRRRRPRRCRARARSCRSLASAGVPRPAEQRGRRVADEVLRRRRARAHDFEAGIRGAAGDAREPALPVPPRGDAGRRRGRARTTASAISIWRRGCRSSSGARCPTPSC